MSREFCLGAVALIFIGVAHAESGVNLLKNGSFEGGKRYWYESEDKQLVKGDAANGEYALRIEKGGIQSAAFLLEQNRPVLLSFSAKADKEITLGWQLTPCGREIGVKHGLTWGMRGKHPVKIGTEWKRYSFSFTPNTPQDGFWPRPTYMLQMGDGTGAFLLDAVTVAYDAGKDGYVPRREIEVQIDCPDLPGYKDPSGNTLPAGATVTLSASASNPGDKPRAITLRWQLVDYEGERTLSDPIEKTVTVAPGKSASESVRMTLTPRGCVLARVCAVENGKILDSSDIPLTTLPYPMKNTKPDWRERFGGSFAGSAHCIDILSRAGFGWARWFPHMNWEDHQKNGPDEWHWFDKELDLLESHGMSTHAVLYGNPKWALTNDPKNPLPKDMQWKADDPRWDDLATLTAWDKFVIEAVKHYARRSLVWEIENEPEFDHWLDGHREQYVKFTVRTARLIKQTQPDAKVMMNQVYGIPSELAAAVLKSGGGKYLDIISWHDYHDGWLADASALKRMRQAVDDAGCKHIEIWFNEGWAYTNTAVDEPAVALTHYNTAQGTHAAVDSVAELSVNGQEKTILFHLAYEDHGQSFWDYSGPGEILWDWNGYPLPLLSAWNVLNHHIGISKAAGFVRPPGANFCIFDDQRNGRGVCIAYADRESPADAVVALPWSNLIAEDAMGNAVPLAGNKLVLSKSGRPVFLYSPDKVDGKTFAEKLGPLDRRNASFVTTGDAASPLTFKLPLSWEGKEKGSAEGNPLSAAGQPVWRVDQVWPDKPIFADNYIPLTWNGTEWGVKEHGQGGAPRIKIENGAAQFTVLGPWNGANVNHQKLAALGFIAPKSGLYRITGKASAKPWEGGAKSFEFTLQKKDTQRAAKLKSFILPRDGTRVAFDEKVELTTGHVLMLLPLVPEYNNALTITLDEFEIQLEP